jgi:oxygen-independent coproporphyrinogen-3 oxidase
LPFSTIAAPLKDAEEEGLIERDLKRIRPSAKGQRFLNELLGLFLRDQQPPGRS